MGISVENVVQSESEQAGSSLTKSSHPLIYLNSTMHLFLVLVFILHDQSNNESLCQKIESIQYNAALAITGAIRGTSQAKLAIQWIRFSISQV